MSRNRYLEMLDTANHICRLARTYGEMELLAGVVDREVFARQVSPLGYSERLRQLIIDRVESGNLTLAIAESELSEYRWRHSEAKMLGKAPQKSEH